MAKDETVEYFGSVLELFAHRFILDTEAGHVLANLGRKSFEKIHLKPGEKILISGLKRPSEIRIRKLARETEEEDAFPAESKIYEILGKARRRHKHFELRAKTRGGHKVELHVGKDGVVRKEKLIEKNRA